MFLDAYEPAYPSAWLLTSSIALPTDTCTLSVGTGATTGAFIAYDTWGLPTTSGDGLVLTLPCSRGFSVGTPITDSAAFTKTLALVRADG